MSEWGAVLVMFWALYLVDGVGAGRRERLFLSAWRGGLAWRRGWRFWRRAPRLGGWPARTASLAQASWFFAPAWPWAYAVALEDLPVSLTADGLVNRSCAAAARPPFQPDVPRAVRWEDIGKIATSGGWLTLDGRRFAPASEALDAAGLRRIAERLRPLAAKDRAAVITAWHARRFSVTRARRRFAVALGRTRGLAFLNTLQVGGWAALSAGLLTEAFAPVSATGEVASWRQLGTPQGPWWMLIAGLVLAHGMAVWEAWSLHRRLHPERAEDRANLIFSALLLPPQALRLRAALMRPLARGLAPLAGALVAGRPATARAVASATWRDVLYPMRPATLPGFFAKLGDEATALVRPAVERALAEATAGGLGGVMPAELDAAPGAAVGGKFGRGVCAYCPRCGDGFVRADGVCPQGVALRSVDGVR